MPLFFFKHIFFSYAHFERMYSSRIFVTEMGIPTQPLDVTVVKITGGYISLKWNPPNNTGGEGIDEYMVYMGQLESNWLPVCFFFSFFLW